MSEASVVDARTGTRPDVRLAALWALIALHISWTLALLTLIFIMGPLALLAWLRMPRRAGQSPSL